MRAFPMAILAPIRAGFQAVRNQPMAFVVLALAFVTVFLLPFSRAFNIPLGMLALVGVFVLARHAGWIWRQQALRWTLLFLLALWLPQFWGLINAQAPSDAYRTLALTPLYGFVLVAVYYAAAQLRCVDVLLFMLLGLALLWSLDGLLQFVIGQNLLGYPYNGYQITGMFHPNRSLGIVLAHLLPLLFEAVRRLSIRSRWWLAVLLPIFMAIVLSGTRYAMFISVLAVGIYSLYLFWHYHWPVRRLLAVLAVGLVVVVAVLLSSEQTRERVFALQHLTSLDRSGMDQAFANRGTVWWGAWQVAQDDWLLGVGARGYDSAVVDRGYVDYSWTHPHFFGLEVWVSTGILGLIAFLLFYLLWLRCLWRSSRGAVGMAVMLTVLLAFLPINAHWSIYASFTHGVMWSIIALSLALVATQTSSTSTKRATEQQAAQE